MIFKMPKTSFFLRSDKNKNNTRSLYCRITYKLTKTEFSLKEKINPKNWNQSIQKMKGNSVQSRYVNALIEKTSYNIKTFALSNECHTARDLVKSFNKKNEPEISLLEIIEKYIDAVAEKVKDGTLRNHKIKADNLRDYQDHRGVKLFPQNFTLPEAELFID